MARSTKKTTKEKAAPIVPSSAVEQPKRKVGRPSSYDPSFCETVIQLGAEGNSPVAIAAHFNVTRTTLYAWADEHPEFLTALKRAKELEQVWWENAGRDGMYMQGFNAAVWRTSMQARFRDDYTERKISEVTGPGGGPMQVLEHKRIDVRLLEPEQREALKQLLIAARENASATDEE